VTDRVTVEKAGQAKRKLRQSAPAADPRWPDLESKEFAVRSKASQQLTGLGPSIERALRQALADAPAFEVRRQVESLLQSIEQQQVRDRRAIEVLEWKNTASARQLLEKLSQGAPDALITQEAKSSLTRLAAGSP
jgi:predicted Zn-dependent protease